MAPSATSDGTNGAQADLDFSTFQNVINGKLTSTKNTRHGINPATAEPLPEVPVATPADVDAAVDAAKEAFKSWSKTEWSERQKACQAFGDALAKYKEQFAKLLTKEQGKPVSLEPFCQLPAEYTVTVGEYAFAGRSLLSECPPQIQLH